MDIQTQLNSTAAGQLAKAMDAKDGSTDGKIKASVWNEFIGDLQSQEGCENIGKRINNFISIENAMKSLVNYAVRAGAKLKQDATKLANEWINKAGGEEASPADQNPQPAQNPPADGNQQSNIPVKVSPPDVKPPAAAIPKKYTIPPQHEPFDGNKGYTEPDEENKGKEVNNGDGTVTIYNRDGYITRIMYTFPHPAAGKVKMDTEFDYDDYGNRIRLERCVWIEYDRFGKPTRDVYYNADGSVDFWEDYEYNADGNDTREIGYNADGSIKYWWDTEYNRFGKPTRDVVYNADGSIRYWIDYEYDADGSFTRPIYRNADGGVKFYEDYVDGEWKKFKPDGTPWEDE